MSKFQELQDQHLLLLGRYEQDRDAPELVSDAKAFVESARLAGREIAEVRERNQLRANLRFWAAFIYEHAGTYPSVDLLPAETAPAIQPEAAPPTPAEAPATPRRVRSIYLIGLVVLCLVMAALAFIAYLPSALPGAKPPSGTPSMEITMAPAAASLTPTMASAATDFTPLVTKTRADIPANTPTVTPTNMPTLTPPPLFSPTAVPLIPPPTALVPTPTETPTTGGAPAVQVSYDPNSDCSGRSLSIVLDYLPEGGTASAELSLAGSGEIIGRKEINSASGLATLDLQNPLTNQSYLLQVEGPSYYYDPVILQFLSNCTRNLTTVRYTSAPADYHTSLVLKTWGGSYDGQSWIARMSISSSQDGIYWFSGADPQATPSLITGDFYVSARNCGPAYFSITDATGGYSFAYDYSVYAPLSFCESPP